MFEACLHLVKPPERPTSLSTCLFSSRRHGPLPQGSCELAASSSWPATCSSAGAAAGANEHFKCRYDRRGPRASRSHAHRAEGVRPNRLTFTADGGLARRSRYPLLVRSHLTRQLAGRIDGLVGRVVAEGSRPRPPAAHRRGGLLGQNMAFRCHLLSAHGIARV